MKIKSIKLNDPDGSLRLLCEMQQLNEKHKKEFLEKIIKEEDHKILEELEE